MINMKKEFCELANKLDKIECPLFALWYLLPYANEVLEKEREYSNDYLLDQKVKDLKKSVTEIREILADKLW